MQAYIEDHSKDMTLFFFKSVLFHECQQERYLYYYGREAKAYIATITFFLISGSSCDFQSLALLVASESPPCWLGFQLEFPSIKSSLAYQQEVIRDIPSTRKINTQ